MGKRWIPALVILVALFGWWMTRGPAIRPEEIDLDVVLRAPGMGENLQPGQADAWTLEIQLDKGTARPLGSHQVLPYVEGFSLFPWDFFQGLTLGHKGGSPVGEAGFHIGQDSRFRAPTGSALRTAGFSVSPARLETARGFMYTGEQFPARVRFYLKGDGAPRPEQTVVVFTYRQIWLGRDLSWTKVVPARVETRAADEQAFTVLGLQPGQALSRTWFQGGQAMLWAPQPGKFSVGASLKQPDGSWTAASAPTTVTAADPLNFRQAVDLGPVTAIFGRTDHTSADAVLVTVAGAEPLRSEVRDGYWVVAHAGRLDPLDLIDLQYVSGRGTPIAGDLFSLAPRCRPSEPEPREGTTRIQLFFMCDEDLLMAPPRPTFRLVPSAPNPVEAALTELLRGPTAAERKTGFTSWFSDQTAGMLRSVRLTPQGRAVVDFDAALPRTIPNASTSAGSMALRMELAHTLFQFPEVKEIEPLVDGRCEVFGAWMQTDCLVIKRP